MAHRRKGNNRIRAELLRFLGTRTVKNVHVLEGTRVGPALRVDLERAVRELLPSLSIQVSNRGLSTLRPLELKDSDAALSLDNLLAAEFAGQFGAVRSISHPVGPGRTEQFPDQVLHLCRGGTFPLAVSLVHRETYDDYCLQAAVRDAPAARPWAADLLDQLERWASTHSIYRRQTLCPSMNYDGEKPQTIRFADLDPAADVQLDPRVRADIDRSLLSFIRHADYLNEVELGSQRGLLFCGEPGTGKTTTCRYLRRNLPDHTFVLVESKSMPHLRGIFALARTLAPSVVVIEDVDLVVQSREREPNNPPLRDLLNAMDGLERRDRVVVILTSNSWHFIEGALADRPGRVDHVIFFERPAPSHRRVLLEIFTRKLELDVDLDDLVQLTDGFTPAELLELTKRAVMEALNRRTTEGEPPRVRPDDFRFAHEGLRRANLSHRSRKTIGLVP
jgi:hypothetical protein